MSNSYVVCEGKSLTTRRNKIIKPGEEVFCTDFGDEGDYTRIKHLVDKGLLKKVEAIEVSTETTDTETADAEASTGGAVEVKLTPQQKAAKTRAATKAKKEADEKAAAEAKEKADAEAKEKADADAAALLAGGGNGNGG